LIGLDLNVLDLIVTYFHSFVKIRKSFGFLEYPFLNATDMEDLKCSSHSLYSALIIWWTLCGSYL